MIYTSYFAKYRYQNINSGEGVSIAISAPAGFKGRTYKQLAPSYSLLKRYKDGLINPKEYTQIYQQEILSKLDPRLVYQQLDNCVLLCWEKSGEFCHRHIVAKWFFDFIGVKVEELKK